MIVGGFDFTEENNFMLERVGNLIVYISSDRLRLFSCGIHIQKVDFTHERFMNVLRKLIYID